MWSGNLIPDIRLGQCSGHSTKDWRISEFINSFSFPKYTRFIFEESKTSAEPIPVMSAIVHLPQEHETTAASTFPQRTGIARTFHQRTNQPPSTAQGGHSLQNLLFFPVLFVTPHFTSAQSEDVAPSICFTQTFNLFTPISTCFYINKSSDGTWGHGCVEDSAVPG